MTVETRTRLEEYARRYAADRRRRECWQVTDLRAWCEAAFRALARERDEPAHRTDWLSTLLLPCFPELDRCEARAELTATRLRLDEIERNLVVLSEGTANEQEALYERFARRAGAS